MKSETLLAIALLLAACAGFGFALVRRARVLSRRPAPRPARRPGWRPAQALLSPGGEWIAVVFSAPAFEQRLDRLLESALWWLMWLLPAPLCRIELAIFAWSSGTGDRAGDPAGNPAGDSAALDRTLESDPAAARTLWRGPGGHKSAREVRLAWTSPSTVLASFQGTSHRLEVKPIGIGS